MSGSVRISIHEIKPGVACGSDIFDGGGRLLLGRGIHLTRDYLQRLTERGITHVSVASADLAALRGGGRAKAKQPAKSAEVPLCARRVDRSGEPYSTERAERFASQLSHAVDIVEEIGQNAITISRASLTELCKVPVQIAEMLAEDSDQSLSSSKSKAGVTQLSERCVQMSMLAMSTAIELELSDADIVQAGIAGLLHDMGLFLLPDNIRNPSMKLSLDEIESYKSHPELTLDLLKNFSEVSEEALLLMLQVHELPDGSGFPRRIRAGHFHALTHVMSTVEIYLALINPGPGRLAIVPHDALRLMHFQCRKGILNAGVMRAFVNQMTMFSIGSLVELDDGQRATVVRRAGNCFEAPVVNIEGAPLDELILLSESDRSISALVYDMHCEMSIANSLMATIPLESMLRTASN